MIRGYIHQYPSIIPSLSHYHPYKTILNKGYPSQKKNAPDISHPSLVTRTMIPAMAAKLETGRSRRHVGPENREYIMEINDNRILSMLVYDYCIIYIYML